MIHQHIFAVPKPGLGVEEFQRYWLEVHAPQYASRIPQILRYRVCLRLRAAGDSSELPFEGLAEIWLRDAESQIASLQSQEFLEGARQDEPRWAAFWQTLVVDTSATYLVGADNGELERVKWLSLVKRAPGLDRASFAWRCTHLLGEVARDLPGLSLQLQAFTVDGAYGLGEPPFDAVLQLGFDKRESLAEARGDRAWTRGVLPALGQLADLRHLYHMAFQERWVIRPGERDGGGS